MKKSFLFILCSFILLPICANAACGVRHIEFQGNQDPNDDEFIYASSSGYTFAEEEYAKENYSFNLNNTMWECDNEQGCKDDTYVLAPAGHAWDGKTNLPEAIYHCDTVPDEWEPTTQDCRYDSNGFIDDSYYTSITIINDTNQVCYRLKGNPNRICCESPEYTACKKAQLAGQPANWTGQMCNCGDNYEWNGENCFCNAAGGGYIWTPGKQCNSSQPNTGNAKLCTDTGGTWDAKNNKCICDSEKNLRHHGTAETCVCTNSSYTYNPNTKSCEKPSGNTEPISCEQSRCTNLSGDVRDKCIACCHVTADVAKWNRNTNTCICAKNASYLFVPNPDPKTGGFCIPQPTPAPTPTPAPEPSPEPAYECDSEIMAQLMTWQAQYASNATISAQIMLIIQYCEDDDPNENTFNVMYSQLVALINQENAAAQLTQQQNASRRRIEGAISDIDSVVSTLDRSKWKNAEGGFNTSRLLSDSIAGVVLGTAGGLITSHVVKKNQVEGGFEDIQCTVGGQVVAGWGDEFQVGIQ